MVATRACLTDVSYRQSEQLALLPQHPESEADDDEARDERKMDLDPLWLQPRRAERRQQAHQDDSGRVGERHEYAQNQGVDRLAAGADNVGRGDRLAVPRRCGMHGPNPETGKNVKKHLLSRDRCASCPDEHLTILSAHVISQCRFCVVRSSGISGPPTSPDREGSRSLQEPRVGVGGQRQSKHYQLSHAAEARSGPRPDLG